MTATPRCEWNTYLCDQPARYRWTDASGHVQGRCSAHARRLADVLRRHPECGSLEPLATKTKEKATHARTA